MAIQLVRNSTNELESFWKKQNDKLMANPNFAGKNLFEDMLVFKSHHIARSNIVFDLRVFELEHIKLENAGTLEFEGEKYSLSLKDYARLLINNVITPKNIRMLRGVHTMLMHIGGFLNREEGNILSSANIRAFHLSFLTESINEMGIMSRISPLAFKGTYNNFNIPKARDSLRRIGVLGVLDTSLTSKKNERELDAACRSAIGVSRKEFAQGASFNFLTLEMGQFYAGFLKDKYEQDYLYTLVCRQSISKLHERWDDIVYNTSFAALLCDKKPKCSSQHLKRNLQDEVFKQYKIHFASVQSLKEDNLSKVVDLLGLDLRHDSLEAVRILMLQKYHPFEGKKSPSEVWMGYCRSLGKINVESDKNYDISVDDVYTYMDTVLADQHLNKKGFLKSLFKWTNEQTASLRREVPTFADVVHRFNLVEDAMATLFATYLGWRQSELGFPLSAIHVEPNYDVLDISHVPFRFKVKWIVPKTNDVTKIDREITSQCYQIAAQLSVLFKPEEGEPCLYANRGKALNKPTQNESESVINRRVTGCWPVFVKEYKLFNDVRELMRLVGLGPDTLSHNEKKKLESLSQLHNPTSDRTEHILKIANEVERDFDILDWTLIDSRKQQVFKESLNEYVLTGVINNPTVRKIVEDRLSEDTLGWLRSHEVRNSLSDGKQPLTRKVMTDISTELRQGVRYPSSHAVRHMWAEAVLNRYQGDVGAVIRHQFCHLDNSFFMAYLRNKEVQGIVDMARIKIINSLVDKVLIEQEETDKEYVGGFSRYVKRARSLTRAVASNELRNLRDVIAGRVISLQPSSFSTCVPRSSAEGRAKCSQFGYINPQDASPSFCLNCPNALITSGHIKGIWLTLMPFIKESLNEDVMGFMVEPHLPILRSGKKRLEELKTEKNSEQLNKITASIETAIISIQEKLKTEEALYA